MVKIRIPCMAGLILLLAFGGCGQTDPMDLPSADSSNGSDLIETKVSSEDLSVENMEDTISEQLPTEAQLMSQLNALLLDFSQGHAAEGVQLLEESEDEEYWELQGTYGFTGFNAYGEETLKQFYGEHFETMFVRLELQKDGTGEFCENTSTIPVDYVAQEKSIQFLSIKKGLLQGVCEDGKITISDDAGNVYVFSKLYNK